MTETKLTKDIIRGWSGTETLKQMSNPEVRAEIERVWNEPEVDQEAVAEAQRQAEEVAASAATAEAIRVQAESEAEAKRLAEIEAAKVVPTVTPTKIVVDYQASDEQGNPIGRPTHLEADTWEEMSKKQTQAHVNAVRALERMKGHKVSFKKKQEEPVKIGMTDAEILQIAQDLNEDPAKAAKAAQAVRKLSNADAAEERERKAQEAIEEAHGRSISYQFMRNHLNDFNPCQANSDILTEYIQNNNLEWTVDNLEIAFAATESQLAPPTRPAIPASVPAVDNPPAPAPAVTAAPVVVAVPEIPAVPPVVVEVAPAPVPVIPANPVIPVRRVPNGGIQPGGLSGRPPVQVPVGLTKKDIKDMPRDEYKRRVKDPKFVAEVNALFAKP